MKAAGWIPQAIVYTLVRGAIRNPEYPLLSQSHRLEESTQPKNEDQLCHCLLEMDLMTTGSTTASTPCYE